MNPWEVEGVPWKTEAAFWSWVRGVLRRGWSRHPIKIAYLKSRRKRIPSPKNPDKDVWGQECEMCHNDFVQSFCEVNHIRPSGSLSCKEDLQGFTERLFYVVPDDLSILCKNCHEVETLSQKLGISIEEARLEKDVITICKRKAKEVDGWLLEHGVTGHKKNPEARRECVRKALQQMRTKIE